MSSVTFDDGTTFTDDADPNTGLAGGGFRKRLVPMVSKTVGVAASVQAAKVTAEARADQAGGNAEAAAANATKAAAAADKATAAAAAATALASGSATARAALRPTLLMDFANGRVLDPRAAFACATTRRRTNEFGLAETVLAGVPRITYDAWSLNCQGLRIEKASTNLLTRSNDFSGAGWSKGTLGYAPAAALAPDGTLTATKLTPGASSAQWGMFQSHTGLTAGGGVSTTVEARAGEYGICQIWWAGNQAGTTNGVSNAYANFDLNSGQASGTADVIAIRRLQDGWWRCTAALTAIGALESGQSAGIAICNSLSNGRRPTISGDGTSGLYLSHVQSESGSDPTSIIPTTTAQTTRAAETCTLPASPWLRQGEGTMVVEFNRSFPVPVGLAPRVLTLHDGTANNRIALVLGRVGANTQVFGTFVSAGVEAASTAANITPDTTVRVALAWKAGDAAVYVNGIEVWTGTTAAIPAGLTTLSLGTDSAGANQLNGTLSRVAYYPTRLAAANCNAMTA